MVPETCKVQQKARKIIFPKIRFIEVYVECQLIYK